MFEQEPDEALMRAKRGPMDAQGCFFNPVFIGEDQVEPSRLCKVHLVGCQGELFPDYTPDLSVNFGAIEGGFVGSLHERYAAIGHGAPHHFFRLHPQALVIHVFLAQAFLAVQRKAHDVFRDPEQVEIFLVHVHDPHELLLELVFCHVHVGIVHLH